MALEAVERYRKKGVVVGLHLAVGMPEQEVRIGVEDLKITCWMCERKRLVEMGQLEKVRAAV